MGNLQIVGVNTVPMLCFWLFDISIFISIQVLVFDGHLSRTWIKVYHRDCNIWLLFQLPGIVFSDIYKVL